MRVILWKRRSPLDVAWTSCHVVVDGRPGPPKAFRAESSGKANNIRAVHTMVIPEARRPGTTDVTHPEVAPGSSSLAPTSAPPG